MHSKTQELWRAKMEQLRQPRSTPNSLSGPPNLELLLLASLTAYRLNIDGTVNKELDQEKALQANAELERSGYSSIGGISPTRKGLNAACVAFKQEKEPGTIIIAYRGTASSDDLISDAQLGMTGTANSKQLSDALEFYKAIKSANPNSPIILSGHSLGGNIATHVGMEISGENTNFLVRTFNSAPTSGRKISNFRKNHNNDLDKFANYTMQNDVVSAGTFTLGLLGRVYCIKARAQNIVQRTIGAHSLIFMRDNMPLDMRNMRISSDPCDLINEKIQGMLETYDYRVSNQLFSGLREGVNNLTTMQTILDKIKPEIEKKDLIKSYQLLDTHIKWNTYGFSGTKSMEMLNAIRQEILYALFEETKKELVDSIQTGLSEENATIEVEKRMSGAGISQVKYQDILKEIKLDLRSSFEPKKLPDQHPNIDADDDESDNMCTL